jgi:hypothetical protein
VKDIARSYSWVDTDRGETLVEARERAARLAEDYFERAAAVDRDARPGSAKLFGSDARSWAERARTPEPFRRGSGEPRDRGQVHEPEHERREQLARWHTDDHRAEASDAADADSAGDPAAVREW